MSEFDRRGINRDVKETFTQKVSHRVWREMLQRFDMEFSEQSEANLNAFNDVLSGSPGVIYINHTSMKDAPLAISMALSHLGNAKQILGPAGMKHYDWRRDPFSALALRSLKLVNIHALPVVQVSDDVNYGAKRSQMLERLKEQTQDMITKPGSVYGITPEGTRNTKDGSLLRANRGIGYLAEHEELYYLPVALMYKEFTENPGVVVGTPQRLNEIISQELNLPLDRKEKAQFIADVHMVRLAKLMPEELWGVYST